LFIIFKFWTQINFSLRSSSLNTSNLQIRLISQAISTYNLDLKDTFASQFALFYKIYAL
jgi:hypothetical protein